MDKTKGQSPVNSAGTKSSSKTGGMRNSMQTDAATTALAVNPNEIALQDRAEYDIMRNLPEVKQRKLPQAPPEQSCCSCKCTIF